MRTTRVLWLIGVVGTAVVGLLGPSAAVPPLPGSPHWPPYSLALGPSDGLVYGLEALTVLAGAAALWRMLRALSHGWTPDPRRLLVAGFLVATGLTLLPPVGGGDITSYVAYGQEDATGVNPYLLGPQSPGVPQTPITRAVEPPWQTTPTVYGPVFTKVTGALVGLAHGDGHLAVTLTRLLLTGGFLITGLVLQTLAGSLRARRRAAVLWAANPLLLYTLVAGAHVDGLVAATLVCTLALLRRMPVVAGAVIGLAATIKLSGLVVLPGALWAVHHRTRAAVLVAVGAVAFALPWFATTDGAFNQLRRASKFATPAAPWRAVSSVVQPVLGYSASRSLVGVVAGVVGLALVALLLRRGLPPAPATTVGRAAAVTSAFAISYVLTATYVLPWYDALAWAPLALVGASFLDRVLLGHSTVLMLAFLPGRDTPLSAGTDLVNRVVHAGISPVAVTALIIATALLAHRCQETNPLAAAPGASVDRSRGLTEGAVEVGEKPSGTDRQFDDIA